MPAATVACISLRMSRVAAEAVCTPTVAIVSRRTSNAPTDVVVLAAMVADNSRSVAVINSISESVVAAEMVAAISLRILNDAVESVCVANDDVISRRIVNSGVLVPVVTAIVVVSSRIVPTRRVISDNDVVTAIADVNSRSTPIAAVVVVVAAIVVTSSRVTAPASIAIVAPHVPRVTSIVSS